MLKCKFKVDSTSKNLGCRQLKLSACNSKEGDNQDWSKYTPSGSFETIVTNEAAFARIDAIEPGDLFYIALEPVPK